MTRQKCGFRSKTWDTFRDVHRFPVIAKLRNAYVWA
jgi:hypothetical protein